MSVDIKYTILFIGCILLSLRCRVPDTYYVHSPVDNKQKLEFTWMQSLIPGKKTDIKISIPDIPHASITIQPVMDFNVLIYWGDTIKVRGGTLIKADNSSNKINWLKSYTQDEYKEIIADTIRWQPVFLNLIPKGHYK